MENEIRMRNGSFQRAEIELYPFALQVVHRDQQTFRQLPQTRKIGP